MKESLLKRSQNKCELSGKTGDLSMYVVLPKDRSDNEIVVLTNLLDQLEGKTELNPDGWQFLSNSMWSEIPAVQVISWRLLQRFKTEAWAAEALEILYLDEETLAWAKAVDLPGVETDNSEGELVHKDTFGNILSEGDSVVLTRTLDVKGSSIHAKLGTVVRNIRLDPNNSEQIEGRVEGQQIVILTKFLRKQG